MSVSAQRAFNLLKELAYEKVSCSPEEKKAALRLLEEAKACGVQAHIEEFSVPCGRVSKAKLFVTAPYVKEYDVTGYERAKSTPEGGLEGELYYAENLLPLHLERCKGKIVLMNGRLRRADFEKLQKAGALAILTFSGSTVDRLSDTDCDIRKLRETLTEPFGDAVEPEDLVALGGKQRRRARGDHGVDVGRLGEPLELAVLGEERDAEVRLERDVSDDDSHDGFPWWSKARTPSGMEGAKSPRRKFQP
jgi:hypothetical protein